jgi:hypothetical protein
VSPSSLTTSISASVNGAKPAGTKWLENPSRVTTTFHSGWSLMTGIILMPAAISGASLIQVVSVM